MNIDLINNETTMNSYDFLNKIINPARVAAGEVEVRHNKLIEQIEDELSGENLCYTKSVAQNSSSPMSRKQEIDVVELNMKQMLLLGMRGSKFVRKAVLSKLEEMQKTINLQQEVINESVAINEYVTLKRSYDRLKAQQFSGEQLYYTELRINEILLDEKYKGTQIDELVCLARQNARLATDRLEDIIMHESTIETEVKRNHALTGIIENKLGIPLKK